MADSKDGHGDRPSGAPTSPTDDEAPPVADQFGGPKGAFVLCIVMPVISFYLWSAIEQHGGSLWIPGSGAEFLAMFPAPTTSATALFFGWFALQLVLYLFVPGKVMPGLASARGEPGLYRINGLLSFGISAALIVLTVATGWVPASTVLDNIGPLLTISTLFVFGMALLCYVWGRGRGALERSTGNVIYDFYLGTVLNPRIGSFDLKFFFESRMGMMTWAAFAILLPAAEIEQTGTISTAMLVVTLCQVFYIIDFFIFESILLSMIDIIEENFGFMLWHGFMVWIPFNFTLQQQYILETRPELGAIGAAAVILLNFLGYIIFRDSNLQKQRFRRAPTNPVWGRPPLTLKTKRGTELLISGWWGLARHTNYLGDLMMAAAWCLAAGFGSIVPYFYFLYFTPLLINRERRDHAMCKRKYGDDWDRYCEKVPYRIIPYVY